MSSFALHAAFALALAAGPASAQPTDNPEQARRSIDAFAYLMNPAGDKVFVSTKIWRNDAKYDDRAFHRFLEVLAALEKRGFRPDEKAVIDSWTGEKRFARCFVYLEDVQAGGRSKTALASGTRVWCAESGISEAELKPSESPKHVEQVMQRFDTFLGRARQSIKK